MIAESRRALAMALATLGVTFAAGATASAAAKAGPVAENFTLTNSSMWASMRPLPGHTARGVAQLTATPGEPPRIIGVLMSLSLAADPSDSSGNTVYLGVSRRSCGELRGALDINDLYIVDRPLEVAPNGTAYLDDSRRRRPSGSAPGGRSGHPPAERLRRARSLAIVGDWDGDGTDEIAACGPLAVDRGQAAGSILRATAAHLGDGFGGARLLAHLSARREGSGRAVAAITGLEPNTRYAVGRSRRTCSRAGDRYQPRTTPLAWFTTDASGSASVYVKFAGVRFDSVDQAGSLCITRAGTATIALGARLRITSENLRRD